MQIGQEGVLLVNKLPSYTSFDVVSKIRKTLKVKKVGHAGTLDPFATGLLIILIGRYTKLSDFFLNGDKAYKAVVKFGVGTDTHDLHGKHVSCLSKFHLTEDMVKSSLSKFCGEIYQIPPNFSAIKINGKRAYKMARNGENFEINPRKITIYEIKLLNFSNPYAELLIKCSKGTYIRSIARDIGKYLNIPAHLNSLCRIESSNFHLKDSLSQDKINDIKFIKNFLITGKNSLKGISTVDVCLNNLDKFNSLNLNNNSDIVYCDKNDIIAIGRVNESKLFSTRRF